MFDIKLHTTYKAKSVLFFKPVTEPKLWYKEIIYRNTIQI